MRPTSVPGRRHRAAALLVAVLVIGGVLAGCDDGSGGKNGKDGGEMSTDVENGLVCGLVDTSLVRKVVPAGDKIRTSGPGVRTREQRKVEPANCIVDNGSTYTAVMQLSIGEYSPAEARRMLDTEAADDPDCTKRYTDDPGHGYGCVHDQGVYVNGASVNVLRGDRLIRVTVYHWLDATPEERLALAEEVTRDIDKNLTAYDRAHS